MTDISFRHGAYVTDNGGNLPVFQTSQSSVIVLFGEAPDMDTSVFSYDEPYLFNGWTNRADAEKLGDCELKDALDDVWDQGGDRRLGTYVYVVPIESGLDAAATLSNMVGDAATDTGVHAVRKIESKFGRNLMPKIFAAPGYTGALAADGINAVNMTERGTGYTTASLSLAGGDGAGLVLEAIVDPDDGGVDIIVKKPGFGFTVAPTITITGDGTGATAEATIGAVGNPVVHEMEGLLEQYRAVAFVDGPNTTDANAVVTSEKYGSDRIYVCDPYVMVWDTTLDAYVPRPSSGRFAGVQARVDHEIGFYASVSNHLIYGIDDVNRAISYGSQTNYLNENQVNTVVNFGNGFRTWGNRSTANKFLAQRRARDFINEAIEKAHLPFVGRPLTKANAVTIAEQTQLFFEALEGRDYMLPGSRAFYDPEKNTAQDLKAGRLTLSVKYETPPPMELISTEAYDNIQAYDILLGQINGAIENGPLALAA
jgi:phage tail sheath protein FI